MLIRNQLESCSQKKLNCHLRLRSGFATLFNKYYILVSANAIPHLEHLPGLSLVTSRCIGHL